MICSDKLHLACKEFFLRKLPFTCFVYPSFCKILPIHHLIYFTVFMINFFPAFCNFFKSKKVCKFLKVSSLYISFIRWNKTTVTSNTTMINTKRLQLCNVPLLGVVENLVVISFFASGSLFNVSPSAADGICCKRKNKPRLNVSEKKNYRLIQEIWLNKFIS